MGSAISPRSAETLRRTDFVVTELSLVSLSQNLAENSMCDHLEVDEFGLYSIDVGGEVQAITLQRCIQCSEFLTLDSKIVPKDSIIERIVSTKENMRTLRSEINSEVYEKLQDLIRQEIGDNRDPSLIMSEIIAMGLIHYRRTLARNTRHR